MGRSRSTDPEVVGPAGSKVGTSTVLGPRDRPASIYRKAPPSHDRADRLLGEAPPRSQASRDPRGRRSRRIAEDRLPGARHLRQCAARCRGGGRGTGGDRRTDLGADDRAFAGDGDRPLLRHPGWPDQPDQGPRLVLVALLPALTEALGESFGEIVLAIFISACAFDSQATPSPSASRPWGSCEGPPAERKNACAAACVEKSEQSRSPPWAPAPPGRIARALKVPARAATSKRERMRTTLASALRVLIATVEVRTSGRGVAPSVAPKS